MARTRRFWEALLLVALGAASACSSDDDDAAVETGGTGNGAGRGGSSSSGGTSAPGGSSAAGTTHAGNAGSPNAGNAGTAGTSETAGGAGDQAGAGNEAGTTSQAGAAGSSEGGATGSSGSSGEGGEGGVDDAPPLPGHEFLYMARILGGVLSCSLNQEGVPTLLPGDPIRPTGHATSIAVSPSQKFLYVSDEDDHIYVYKIGADGKLPTEPTSSIATPDYPLGLTIEPQGRFAYVASDQGAAIYTYSIDPDSGALSAVGDGIKVGEEPDFSPPAFIAAEPSGHYVYVSQRFPAGLRGYEIDQVSGALSELDASPFATTGLPAGDNLFGGAIVFTPSGNYAFTSGGALNAFSLDPDTGNLELVQGSPFTLDVASDQNAPNLAIDPQGKYVFASRFLLTNHVSGFEIAPGSGKLKAVPDSPVTTIAPYSLAVEPSGRFVYIGEDAPQMSAYRIVRQTGALEKLEGSPFDLGGLEPKLAFAVLP
jgi:6-phosphogluconolactonase (cycloisomerase 2 family)